MTIINILNISNFRTLSRKTEGSNDYKSIFSSDDVATTFLYSLPAINYFRAFGPQSRLMNLLVIWP